MGASGEPEQAWYELHQRARNFPTTVARIELIRGLHPILARVGAIAPFAPVAVYLDRASESQARGDCADERCALEAAVEFSAGLSDREQREHATVRLAALAWREGKLMEVERLLGPLAGRQAAELRERFDAAAPERAALMEVLGAWQKNPDLVRGACYAWAHQDAGHTVHALEVARALGEQFPGGGVAAAFVGAVLLEQGRCRDAVVALRSALHSGFDETLGEVVARAGVEMDRGGRSR